MKSIYVADETSKLYNKEVNRIKEIKPIGKSLNFGCGNQIIVEVRK